MLVLKHFGELLTKKATVPVSPVLDSLGKPCLDRFVLRSPNKRDDKMCPEQTKSEYVVVDIGAFTPAVTTLHF